jgi:hypothetical protein
LASSGEIDRVVIVLPGFGRLGLRPGLKLTMTESHQVPLEVVEEAYLWHDIYKSFQPHALAKGDADPQAALNRIAAKCIKGKEDPEFDLNTCRKFNPNTCDVQELFLFLEELLRAEIYGKKDTPGREVGPIVILNVDSRNLVVDGNKRLNKWRQGGKKERIRTILIRTVSDDDAAIWRWVTSSQRRHYAEFFDWPDKRVKELGIVKTLLESMEAEGFCPFHSPDAVEKDPPDCVACDQHGKAVAFEVTELVSEKAVKMNKEGREVYFDWNPAAVVEAVEKILEKKGAQLTKVDRTRFSEVVFVIHTDEPTILFQEYRPLLGTWAFQAVPSIDRAYILFSHNPSLKEKYGHVQLALENRGKR